MSDALGQTALTVVAKRALGSSWACGHPVTPDNIAPVGAGRSKCRICRNAYTLQWMNEHNAAKRAGLPYSRRQRALS